MKDLGIVVIDEEHDSSYKQDSYPVYHARDMAVALGSFASIPIVLVSATPSITSLNNVVLGKYKHFKLLQKFFDAAPLAVEILDMKKEMGLLAEKTHQEIERTVNNGQQVLMYVNRRGYAAISFCPSCNKRVECLYCSVYLTMHRSSGEMICHYCDYRTEISGRCADCKGLMRYFGFGVEQLKMEIEKRHRSAKIFIASSDTIRSEQDMRELIDKIDRGEVNIIVATQILTKGYHFPKLTLVGVTEIDLDLAEFGSLEKTYQNIYQISGRAGREVLPGKVIIQTTDPNNKLIQALKKSLEPGSNHDKFVEYEMQIRKRSKMPPYCRLAAIVISSTDEIEVKNYVQKLDKEYMQKSKEGIVIMGPIPCQIYKLRNKFRWNFMIKAGDSKKIHEFMYDLQNWMLTQQSIVKQLSNGSKGANSKTDRNAKTIEVLNYSSQLFCVSICSWDLCYLRINRNCKISVHVDIDPIESY